MGDEDGGGYDYGYEYGDASSTVTPSSYAFLLESSGYILLETGDFLLLE